MRVHAWLVAAPNPTRAFCVQVELSTRHHGATRDDTVDEQLRLDAHTLLDRAAALSSAIDMAQAAGWSRKDEWVAFIADVDKLSLSLDKLGDGSMAQARRVRVANSRTESARSAADPDKLDVKVIEATPPQEPEKYAQLLEELQSVDAYQPLRVLDSHMGLTRLTRTPSSVRRSFFDGLSFEDFSVKRYIYAQGGPYPSTAYVWRISDPLDLVRDAAAIAMATKNAPSTATRAMLREFFDRFSILCTNEAALRALYRHLSPNGYGDHGANQKQIDERCLKFLSRSDDADPQLFYDMRHLNGRDGDKFAAFWEVMGEYLQLEVGDSAHERRHSVDAISYASKIISVPSLIREVTALLHAKEGHENDPIPGETCVYLQYTPNRRDRLAAGRFSARFPIVRKVQTRILRKEHEDAHWVAALARNNKVHLVRARDAAVEANFARGVIAVGLDDKKSIPVGLPGLPVDSGARPHGPVAAPKGQVCTRVGSSIRKGYY